MYIYEITMSVMYSKLSIIRITFAKVDIVYKRNFFQSQYIYIYVCNKFSLLEA